MAKIKKGMFVMLCFFVAITVINIASAASPVYVMSNSQDWKDVYSSVSYAAINQYDNSFLRSPADSTYNINLVPKSDSVIILSSTTKPFALGYKNSFTSAGFTNVTEISSDNLNLRLLNEFPDIDSYIVVGDSYGFNAIAVAPYAKITKSWVLFANSANIYSIDSVLSQRKVKNIIIYGYVDPTVRTVLSKYPNQVIDNNDKFQDNIEIVNMFGKIKDFHQVVLTNGEFIEKEIIAGGEPVLFTGKDDVPTEVRDYIKGSKITVGVLIGNDLINAATTIRRSAGIQVMVKYARSARTPDNSISPVEALDMFPIPVPLTNLTLYSVRYNRANSHLEVTYQSSSNVPVYVKGTIILYSENQSVTVGDESPVFIAPGDSKTIIYPVKISFSKSLRANVSSLFGEAPSSLDRILSGSLDVEIVNIIDKCVLNQTDVNSLKYNKQDKKVYLNIKNPYDFDCWVDADLNKVYVGYRQLALSSEGEVLLKAKSSNSLVINQELTDTDIAKNSLVSASVFSGERQNSLVNTFDVRLPLEVENFSTIMYVIAAIVVVIIILIIIIFIIKRRDKDDE